MLTFDDARPRFGLRVTKIGSVFASGCWLGPATFSRGRAPPCRGISRASFEPTFFGHHTDRQTAKRRERPSLHPIHRKRLAPASTRLPHLVILLDWRRGGVRCGAVRHRGDCCQIKGSERRSNEALHRNSPSLVGRNVRIRWRQKWPSSALAANALFRPNQSESAIGSGNETRAGPGKWPRTRHAHVRPASGAVRGDDSQQRRDGISGPSSVGRRSVRGLPRRSQNASRRGGGRRSGRG
jgi:hypothetical protein